MRRTISTSTKAEAVAMYKNGYSPGEICEKLNVCTSELYRYLKAAGIEPKTRKPSHLRVIPGLENRTPIFAEEIEMMRRSVKVGNMVNIKTQKAVSDGETGTAAIPGTTRKAKVVDTSNRKFCVVELKNGVREAIHWTSFIIVKRNGRSWV